MIQYVRIVSIFEKSIMKRLYLFFTILLLMIRFTYKYISIAIILLFICTSLLSAISANEHVWYAYMIPCILSGVILVKRAKKIDFDKDRLSVWGLYKTDIFYLKDVRKFELFKDAFFYGKTLGINVYLKNGDMKRFYIGTLDASYMQELKNQLSSKL